MLLTRKSCFIPRYSTVYTLLNPRRKIDTSHKSNSSQQTAPDPGFPVHGKMELSLNTGWSCYPRMCHLAVGRCAHHVNTGSNPQIQIQGMLGFAVCPPGICRFWISGADFIRSLDRRYVCHWNATDGNIFWLKRQIQFWFFKISFQGVKRLN